MRPEEIVKPWVEGLSHAKTRAEVNLLGQEAKLLLEPEWILEDFLEMARKRWHQLDA